MGGGLAGWGYLTGMGKGGGVQREPKTTVRKRQFPPEKAIRDTIWVRKKNGAYKKRRGVI